MISDDSEDDDANNKQSINQSIKNWSVLGLHRDNAVQGNTTILTRKYMLAPSIHTMSITVTTLTTRI